MVYRVVKDLAEREDYDDRIYIVPVMVIVLQCYLRSFPGLSELAGIPDELAGVLEFMRRVSRKLLSFVIDWLMEHVLEDVLLRLPPRIRDQLKI